MSTITRRNLVKGAGAAAATVAVASMGTAAARADGQPAWMPAWDEEADVVVVGFGGSGSIAAIEAARQGASVIALEKSALRMGGNLALSSGTLHDSCGCDVDEWVRLYERGTLRCGASADEIRPVLEVAANAPDWAESYGLTLTWADQETAGTTWPAHQVEGQAEKKGAGIWAEIDATAQDEGLDVRTSMRAKRLVQDPVTKEVLGVVAADADGNDVAFKAKKAVIMACGGYEHNDEMLCNYNHPGIDFQFAAHASTTNTGDGFPMVMEAGAKLWHMNDIHYGGLNFPQAGEGLGYAVSAGRGTLGGGGKQGAEAEVPWIIVDRNGRRFMNESYIWAHDENHKAAFDFSTAAAFNKAQFGSADPQVQRYTDAVSSYVHLPMFMVFDRELFDMEDADLIETLDNQDALEAGYIWKADTLEELAAMIHGEAPTKLAEDAVDGIDPEVLKQTVATWNGYAAEGVDPEFLRDAAHVLPLSEEGPYYAAEVCWSLDFTEGGPRRNGRCQTIGVWDEPIPRLYNTGEFGSFNTIVYCIGGVLQALTTGRIAGADAASLEPWC